MTKTPAIIITSIMLVFGTAAAQDASLDPATCDAMFEEDAARTIFGHPEQPPELIGGLAAVAKEAVYPPEAMRQEIEGDVWVWLVVDEVGRPHCARVFNQDAPPLLAEEAIRVVQKARFRPAVNRGKTIRHSFILPLRFRLEG